MTPEQTANYIEEYLYENLRLFKEYHPELTFEQYTWAAIAATSRVMRQLLAECPQNKRTTIQKMESTDGKFTLQCTCGRIHKITPKKKKFTCESCCMIWASQDGVMFEQYVK